MILRYFLVRFLLETAWCGGFGILGYGLHVLMSKMLSPSLCNVIFFSIYPLIMFYALYFCYDLSERWLCRKFNVVRKI